MSNAEQCAVKARLLAMLQRLARQGWWNSTADLAAIAHSVGLANQVWFSLDRLERGEYGKCVRCNQRIAPERLRVLPWTAMCLACHEAEQHGTGTARPAVWRDVR